MTQSASVTSPPTTTNHVPADSLPVTETSPMDIALVASASTSRYFLPGRLNFGPTTSSTSPPISPSISTSPYFLPRRFNFNSPLVVSAPNPGSSSLQSVPHGDIEMDDTPKETDVVEDPDTELTMSLVSLMSRLQLQEEADTPQARTESTCTSTDSDSTTGQRSEATDEHRLW